MDHDREAEIIREVLLGDVQAFGFLVRKYQGPVFNLMLRKTGNRDDAEELAQEAFARAYRKLDRFKAGKGFFPWLYALSLNVHRDWCRARGRECPVCRVDTDALAGVGEAPDEQGRIHGRIDGRRMFAAVMRLDDKYREALLLRFRHELSMTEVADALSIKLSAAKMRVKRGLEMIREQFKEESNGQ